MTVRVEDRGPVRVVTIERPEVRNAVGLGDALSNETRLGRATIASGETRDGATRFAGGEGRHGRPVRHPTFARDSA